MAEPLDPPTDPYAAGYDRWWGQRIAPMAVRVLDLLDDRPSERGAHVLDLGTGTGTLALEAARRWPLVEVVGIDVSPDMLEVAEARRRARPELERRRVRYLEAPADRLPLDAASIDLVVSSFVLQLVASRRAVLAEAARVLRPGGWIAFACWMRGGPRWAPDRVLDAVLEEAGFDPPSGGGPNGDFASVRAAADALRRAGIRDVRAFGSALEHPFTPEEYVGFVTRFDEADTFESLRPRERTRVERQLLEGVARLSDDERTLRLPVVYAIGRRPT